MFSAAKLFFAYGLGNALTFPMAVGATAVLMAERAHAGRRVRPAAEAPAHHLLRRAHALRGAAREPRAARGATSCACAAASPPARRCRRTSAGAGPSASASRSSTASARPRCCTSSSPTAPARCATAPPASRCPGYELRLVDDDGAPVAAGRDRRAADQRARPARPCYWNNREKIARDLRRRAGPAAATSTRRTRDGYYVYARAHRRHAEGERHLRLAVRGRVGADHAPGRAGGGGGRPRGRATSWSSPWPSSCSSPASSARTTSAEELQRHVKTQARALQVSALDRVRRRAAQDRDRQDPALQAACAGGPALEATRSGRSSGAGVAAALNGSA